MTKVHRRAGMSIAGMVADARQIVSREPQVFLSMAHFVRFCAFSSLKKQTFQAVHAQKQRGILSCLKMSSGGLKCPKLDQDR